MGPRVFSVVGIVGEEKPQSLHADNVDGVTRLVQVVGNWCIPSVFDVRHVFSETRVKSMTNDVHVQFGSAGAVDDVHDSVRLAIELFSNVL